MNPEMGWIDPAVLSTAFLAGLLGSGHCFGMCGGIAAGLGAMSGNRAVVPALQFNLARLVSYAVLGLVAATVLSGVTGLVPVGRWLRVLTAVMILLIGLKFLFNFRGVEFIERGGAGLWKKIMPVAMKAGSRQDAFGRLVLGLCWGFIPCGLVYSVLMTAASTANPVSGALTMLTFGAGTLPSMLGLTVAAPALSSFLEDRTVRRLIGFALVVLAIWTLIMMWGAMAQGQMGHTHH
ncbi:MAG: sulfite exporter TauE/SafE family protein [Xanthomonadales bacterium]|nr:sulfite exporter TauE/SafE family protein [Gammaproteobacteria bacterium]NND56178.1 sulfite exporter TauE/SafE family protein [Xanthomonadales bacterium]NNK50583.1 sulfite exporter TauE/SafE family protein [Xanthomonadales bacterium]